jgi:hypothetical protein
LIVGVPVQVPVEDVSVWPSSVVPEIAGGTVLTGGSASTSAVSSLVAGVEPAGFVAVTRTRIFVPTSAGPSR